MPDDPGAGRYEWERVFRRCLLPGPTKAVGRALAEFADADGSNITAGVRTVALSAGYSERATRDALDELRTLGLIQRVRRGSNFGRGAVSDAHRLTIPVDLLERDDVDLLPPDTRDWTPSAARAAAVRRRNAHRSAAGNAADRAPQPVDESVENPGEKLGRTPLRLVEHRQDAHGTPAPHAGTPAPHDKNTGTTCHLPPQLPSQTPDQMTNATTRAP